MARVILVTTYNPGAAGPRYIAGSLVAAGHQVHFIHMKELRAVAVPTTHFDEHERLRTKKSDLAYVSFQHPGEVLYVPYPADISEKEWALFIEEVKAFKPDLVGISMFSVTVEIARQCTERIHNELPGLPVAWGGIHCMVNPEDCVRDKGHARCPDIICVGEGEIPFNTFMSGFDAYKQGERPEIAGIWFVDGTKVKRSGMTPLEKELDKFPFPVYAQSETLIDDDQIDQRYMVKNGFIQNHILFFTERGCPYSCSFCIHSVINKLDEGHNRIRRRSVDNVLDEIELRVKENGIRSVYIHDEIFAIQKSWIMEFAKKYKERFKKQGLKFTGYVHPMCTDADMIEALFDAGMTKTGIGIQTGSYRVSKEVYDRPLNNDRVIECSRNLSQFPFELVQLDLISDSPYETDEDRRETLKLLLAMYAPFRVETFGLVTYKNSTLVTKQRLSDEVPWKERLFWNMLYHLTGTTWLSKDLILEMSYDTYLRENPLILEKLVMDLQGAYFKNQTAFVRLDEKGKSLATAAQEACDTAESRSRGMSNDLPVGANGETMWLGYRMKKVMRKAASKAKRILVG